MRYGHLLNKRVRFRHSVNTDVKIEVVAVCDGLWGWSEVWSCDEARIEYGVQTANKRSQVVRGNNRPLVVLRVQKTPKTWVYQSLYSEDDADKLVVIGDADFRSHIGDLRGVTLDSKIGSNEYLEVQEKASPS